MTSPPGFKARVGSAYSLYVEANAMYIPQDPPLVLHVATSWQQALLPVLSPHTVSRTGEVAGI